jgi:MFS family permease
VAETSEADTAPRQANGEHLPAWRRVPRLVARSGGRAARATGRATQRGWQRLRRATHAHGAGESGLAKLIELHGVSAAADALVAVALANTLFFDVPIGEARTKVALYLALTLAPFAVLAPVIGPVLDRLRGGRRWALAGVFAGRALLAVGLVSAVAGASLWLYPLAFGVLILSRGYGVARSAMVPRLAPPGVGLVRANSRIGLAAIVTATVAVPAGLGVSALFGPAVVLWLAALLFGTGTLLALYLPRHVDVPSEPGDDAIAMVSRRRLTRGLGGAVVRGLRSQAVLRMFSGFLVFFLAFRLRAEPLGGLDAAACIALAAIGLAIGGGVGTWLGDRLGRRSPDGTILVALAALTVATGLTAMLFGLAAVIAIAVVAGGTQALGKLSLDAIIQRDVSEAVRSSAFARSETLLQLAWVLGAGFGTALPVSGSWGFGGAATGLLIAVLFAIRSWWRARRWPSRQA